jgi:hypothetical protein
MKYFAIIIFCLMASRSVWAQSPTPTSTATATPTPTPIPASSLASPIPLPSATPAPPAQIALQCWKGEVVPPDPAAIPCDSDPNDSNWIIVSVGSVVSITAAAVPVGSFVLPNPLLVDLNCNDPNTCESQHQFDSTKHATISADKAGSITGIVNMSGYWSNWLNIRMQ